MPPTLSQLQGFLGKRVQLAFVTTDLENTLKFWTEVLGVGPFVVIESSKGDRKVIHRGQETAMDMTLSFAYMGDIQIEIVHQTNDEPSTYKEFTDRGGEGLHHIAFWPEDFEGACTHLEANGFAEVTSFYMADGTRNVAYYETPGAVGALVEIVPMTPARTAYFSRIQRLCESWDGVTRPVRRFADRAAFLASGEGAE
ncbi:VOC family protein [Paracoccus sp. P2]|uniref:VOC family protein n=1 Tax=Paracoccus sp. P2 TaxID=3248840 RepID=UPI00391FAD28